VLSAAGRHGTAPKQETTKDELLADLPQDFELQITFGYPAKIENRVDK
jgi:hypothetical protein